MAEHDGFFGPEGAQGARAAAAASSARTSRSPSHPGTGHAFMAPHNALGTHDQEAYDRIWPQVLAFLHQHLD